MRMAATTDVDLDVCAICKASWTAMNRIPLSDYAKMEMRTAAHYLNRVRRMKEYGCNSCGRDDVDCARRLLWIRHKICFFALEVEGPCRLLESSTDVATALVGIFFTSG